MITIEGITYYTPRDVVEEVGGTTANAGRHCRALAAERPEWGHYPRSRHRMTAPQYREVIQRIREIGRTSRGRRRASAWKATE